MSQPNPFIDSVSSSIPRNFRAIKEAWVARQLRQRETSFSKFRQLRLFVGTWNVNGRSPNQSLVPWLKPPDSPEVDVYVLGFQELDLSTEAYLVYDKAKEDEWCRAIEDVLPTVQLGEDEDGYVKIVSKQLIGMLVVIYAKKEVANVCSELATESVGTGILGLMGNKGAVGVRLRIDDTYFCFVNAHLAADTGMVERRNQDYSEIVRRLGFILTSPAPPPASTSPTSTISQILHPGGYADYNAYKVANPWVASFLDAQQSMREQQGEDQSGAGGPKVSSLLNSAPLALSPAPGAKPAVTVFDCDHLIWMGDLNYRIALPDTQARDMIQRGKLDQLVDFDQLTMERRSRRTFPDYDEGPLNFTPSYKYDVGTSTFDSSEKRRAPSWTDRILWYKNPLRQNDPEWIRQLSYKSIMDITISDHKPVMGLFDVKVRSVLTEGFMQTYEEISRQLDKFENDALPDIAVDTNILEYGDIRFSVPVTRQFEIENKGQVGAHFRFIPKGDDVNYAKPWCFVNPPAGTLFPGEKAVIKITMLVGNATAASLNFGEDALDDILILHIENGKDSFVSISGTWQPSAFGNDLNVLCRMNKPARECGIQGLKELAKLAKGQKAKSVEELSGRREAKPTSPTPKVSEQGTDGTAEGSDAVSESNITIISDPASVGFRIDNVTTGNDSGAPRLSIPKELWRLVDFIYKYGMDVDNLFLTPGDHVIMEYIRECLDTGTEFDLGFLLSEQSSDTPLSTSATEPSTKQADTEKTSNLTPLSIPPKGRTVSVHAMAECLIRFLDSLAEPVIPYSLYSRCITEGYHSFVTAFEILQSLPALHYNAFAYVTSFLKEVVSGYKGRGETTDNISQVFGPVLLRPPKNLAFESAPPIPNRTASPMPVALPRSTSKPGAPLSATANITVPASPLRPAGRGGGGGLMAVLAGALIAGNPGGTPGSPSLGNGVVPKSGGLQQQSAPAAVDSAEIMSRKRRMFLGHFLEPGNDL